MGGPARSEASTRRGGVGFGLGATPEGFVEEGLDIVGDLGFEVAEVVIGRAEEALDGGVEHDGQAGGLHGQRFGRGWVGRHEAAGEGWVRGAE